MGGDGGGDRTWSRAAALCGWQLPLVWPVVEFRSAGGDDYGQSGIVGAGFFCLLLFAPPFLFALGAVQALAQIVPAAALARWWSRRSGGPQWAWRLVGAALIGTAGAALASAVGDLPLAATVPWGAGSGVLPVLVLALARRRGWGPWGLYLRAAGASAVLLVAGLVLGAALADDYHPPALTAAQLTGDWQGDHGAVLHLGPGGRAMATSLPTEADRFETDSDSVVCAGPGTWSAGRTEWRGGHRADIVVRLAGDCGLDTHWTIGGTADSPELFVLFGDPDAGDLRILTRG
ncbi:hypothetical protein [Streptomyces sp. NPDC003717]|uniref:hypothetical protein n=1 Tax=Streptomyces sp. NPDC003717 TaxID=3154276 RepID=UPI00339EA945